MMVHRSGGVKHIQRVIAHELGIYCRIHVTDRDVKSKLWWHILHTSLYATLQSGDGFKVGSPSLKTLFREICSKRVSICRLCYTLKHTRNIMQFLSLSAATKLEWQPRIMGSLHSSLHSSCTITTSYTYKHKTKYYSYLATPLNEIQVEIIPAKYMGTQLIYDREKSFGRSCCCCYNNFPCCFWAPLFLFLVKHQLTDLRLTFIRRMGLPCSTYKERRREKVSPTTLEMGAIFCYRSPQEDHLYGNFILPWICKLQSRSSPMEAVLISWRWRFCKSVATFL